MPSKGLLARLSDGEDVIVAEGYLFEFERRGYLKAGAYVPEIVLEHPSAVKALHEEFVHAGSDVVLAFTYYAHREKMRAIGREGDLEKINRQALKIARQVADETGTLMAGNLSNTTSYDEANEAAIEDIKQVFKEQVLWAVEGGADFIVGETFGKYGEAKLALDSIKQYGRGCPAVITLGIWSGNQTEDGLLVSEALRKLECGGADVVGLNCGMGPTSILPLLKEAKAVCQGPLAALPVVYHTTEECPNLYKLINPQSGKSAFPFDLPTVACGRSEVANFAIQSKQIGVQYIGLCCGNASHYMRVVAEGYGRKPPASRYSPDMSQHYILGTDQQFVGTMKVDEKKLIGGQAYHGNKS